MLNLLRLSVGADVQLGGVHLEIKGVEAQALLKVRLDKVAETINRVLSTIDRNPEIVDQIFGPLGAAASELEGTVGRSVDEVAGALEFGGEERLEARLVGQAAEEAGVENRIERAATPEEAVTLAEAQAFFRTHYVPANAALAIVGSFTEPTARRMIDRHQDGSAPLASNAESLRYPQEDQRHRRPWTDLLIRRRKTDQEGRDTHDH